MPTARLRELFIILLLPVISNALLASAPSFGLDPLRNSAFAFAPENQFLLPTSYFLLALCFVQL